MDIGLWRRLLERRVNNDPKFRQLCHLNGWSRIFRQRRTADGDESDSTAPTVGSKTLAYFFFASTDLKDLMKQYVYVTSLS